jgi:hypothetical protein
MSLPLSRSAQVRWDCDTSDWPHSFLPANIDRTGWVDVTAIGDSWRKYLDPATGVTHDGAAYYARFQEELESLEANGLGPCCANEQRSMAGGCTSCGDPCL